LKLGGKVILVWNCREPSEIIIENAALNKNFCPEFKGFSNGAMGLESEADIAAFFAGGHDSKIIRKLMKLNSSAEICPRLSPQKR